MCSEYPGGNHHVPGLPTAHVEGAWEVAAGAIMAMGGTIVEQRGDYLRATFTSRVFRFVDDLELRYDETAAVIQVRSASRLGYYDFGVNRRRVAALRAAYLRGSEAATPN